MIRGYPASRCFHRRISLLCSISSEPLTLDRGDYILLAGSVVSGMHRRGRRTLFLGGAGALLAGLGLTVSVASINGSTIESAADIVPSIDRAQLPEDRLLAAAYDALAGTGLVAGNARFLAQGKALTYFAAPLGDIDLCVITVGPFADDLSMSRTPVDGFATYGLRVENL